MPKFVYATCRCGRAIRAKPEQAGSAVRCWGCGLPVLIPREGEGRRLATGFRHLIREAFRAESFVLLLAGSLALAAAVAVPKAGPWLGLAIVTAAAWRYQSLVRDGGDPGSGDARGLGGLGTTLLRVALGVVATLALVAPFVVRNGGRTLPAPLRAPGPGTGTAALLATLGWFAVPLLLAAFNGRDRNGAIGPGRAALGLARHPLATAVALLALPATLLLIEPVLAAFVWWQGQLPLLVTDIFPPPRIDSRLNGAHMVYIYDGLVIERIFTEDPSEILPVYLSGLRRGFTLVGTIPGSLFPRNEVIVYPEWFHSSPPVYVAFRGVMAVLIVSVVGAVLSAQARMLGLIVSVGAGRPGAGNAEVAPAPAPTANAGTGLIPVGGTSFGTGPVRYPGGNPGCGSGPIPTPAPIPGAGTGLYPYPHPNSSNGTYPGSGTYPAPVLYPVPVPVSGGTGLYPVPAPGPRPGTGTFPAHAAGPVPASGYGSGVFALPATYPTPGAFPGAPGAAPGQPVVSSPGYGSGLHRMPAPAAPAIPSPRPNAGSGQYGPPGANAGARSGLYPILPANPGVGALANPLAAVPVSQAPAPGAPGNPALPRILIVDDERPFAEALARVLSTRGFSVTIASDAGEGLRLAHAAHPDLIVLDWMLPDRPGSEVCREIRASPGLRQTPILMTTFRSAPEDEVAALASGADDFLVKPYVIDVLVARIRNQLRKQQG